MNIISSFSFASQSRRKLKVHSVFNNFTAKQNKIYVNIIFLSSTRASQKLCVKKHNAYKMFLTFIETVNEAFIAYWWYNIIISSIENVVLILSHHDIVSRKIKLTVHIFNFHRHHHQHPSSQLEDSIAITERICHHVFHISCNETETNDSQYTLTPASNSQFTDR